MYGSAGSFREEGGRRADEGVVEHIILNSTRSTDIWKSVGNVLLHNEGLKGGIAVYERRD
jgi:hypothetical protein